MKRKYFLLAALCAAMNVTNGFAQDASEKLQLYWPAASSSLWVDDQYDHSMKMEYGFDGDETTRWSAGWEKADNDANYPKGKYWYRACFGGTSVDFNVIRVKWYDNSVKTFQILTSDDYDNDFKVVYTSPAGREHTGWQTYSVGKQHGKAFRIQATEFNTDNDPRFSFYEIEAYNMANPPSDETGVNAVGNADANKPSDIYSVDGRLVRKNATTLNGLERGVYIVNGKKHAVK